MKAQGCPHFVLLFCLTGVSSMANVAGSCSHKYHSYLFDISLHLSLTSLGATPGGAWAIHRG